MIRFFRKQFSDKGFRVVLWISIASFMFANFVPFVVKRLGGGGEGLIAKVNGLDISLGEFLKRVQQEQNRLAFFRQQFGPQADKFLELFGLSANPEEAALNGLQHEKIIDSVARDMHLEIAPAYLVTRLQDSDFLANELGIGNSFIDALGRLDMKKLKSHLRQQGLSVTDLENMIENQLRRSLVFNFAQGAAYTPEFMIRRHFIKNFVPRRYSVLVLPRQHYVQEAHKEAVSGEDLKKFFDRENRVGKRYLAPEKRDADVWTFEPLSYGIDVPDEEIEKRYAKNKKAYLVTPETVTIHKVVFPLLEGADKDTIRHQAEQRLKELKENPKKFPKTITDTLERGTTHDAALARAAFGLKADGEISPVISSKEGLVILQRAHHDDAHYKSLVEVKDDIGDSLILEKFKRRFPQDARRAIDEARIQAFVEEKSAVKNTLTKQEKAGDAVSQKIFSLGLDKYGYFFDKGQGYIVRTTNIEKVRVPELKEIEQQVRSDYYEDVAQKMLQQVLEDMVQGLSNDQKNIDNYVKQPGISLVKTELVDPRNQDELKKLEEQGLPVAVMLRLTAPLSLESEINERGGALIRLDELAPIDQDMYEKEKASIKQSLAAQAERLVQDSFVASLVKNATIKMYVSAPQNKKKPSI